MADLNPERIFCDPGAAWGTLLKKPRRALPDPLGRKEALFFLRGSTALWQGLRHLNLEPGRRVLFPAYHCGVELEVLRQAGLEIVFYGIDRRLRIDPDEIVRLAGPGMAALYVIHYFGFPHPMEDLLRLCASRGWHLIEDCAQALFARCEGVPAGTLGDLGIFSLHKFLPIPCCGALLVKAAAGRAPGVAAAAPPPGFVLRQAVDLLGRNLAGLAVLNSAPGVRFRKALSGWVRLAATGAAEKHALESGPGPRAFLRRWRDSAAPRLSLELLARLPAEDVASRRRGNFAALLESASGGRRLHPLVEAPAPGACPLFFPVAVPGGAERFVAHCRRRGVAARTLWRGLHPAFPRERFGGASWLRDSTVVLPVHQGLGKGDLALLGALMREWERGR